MSSYCMECEWWKRVPTRAKFSMFGSCALLTKIMRSSAGMDHALVLTRSDEQCPQCSTEPKDEGEAQ